MFCQTVKLQVVRAVALLSVIFVAGCRSGAAPDFRALPPESEKVRARANEFAALWGQDASRSVLFRENDFAYYNENLAGLTARLRAMKVNHAYLAAESLDVLDSRSKRAAMLDMITAFSDAGITCDIVLPQHLFPGRRSGNFFGRVFGSGETPFREALQYAVRMKRYLPDQVPAPGVTVWAALHRFTASNELLPAGSRYRWSENDYGTGSDNDIIMKQFMADLAVWREMAKVDNVPFSVAIPAFYHSKAAAGELSAGRVKDFLAVADTVLVMGYGERPSDYLRAIREVLRDDASGRIRCGMVLSGHMSESVGAIRRRSWQDFFKILSAMHQSCKKQPGYGGMVLIPWQSVELLQER